MVFTSSFSGRDDRPNNSVQRTALRADVPGFCKSATLDEVRQHGHVLTPGCYVGAEVQESDGEPFKKKIRRLTARLREQQAGAARRDAAIAGNLKELGYGIKAPLETIGSWCGRVVPEGL